MAALFETPFASYAELGRRVDMTGQDARERVLRLEDEGVLKGFVATPVPAIFGREGAFVTVEDSGVAIDDALELEDVVLAGATIDGLLTVVGYVMPGTREERKAAWTGALGGTLAYDDRYRAHVDPEPPGPLGWRALRALLDEPRTRLTDLADAVGLTARAVRERRQRLVDSGALEVTPLLGPSDEGRIFFHLAVVGYDGPPTRLPAELPGTILVEQVAGVAGGLEVSTGVLFCEARSLAEQHALVERARELEGVEDVRPYLLSDHRVHTERLQGWIDEALDARETARREPPDR